MTDKIGRMTRGGECPKMCVTSQRFQIVIGLKLILTKIESHISDSVSNSNRYQRAHRYRIGSHSFNCQNFQDIFVKIWPMSKSLTLTTSSNPALKDFREFAEIEKVFKSVLSCGPSNTNPRNLDLDRFI